MPRRGVLPIACAQPPVFCYPHSKPVTQGTNKLYYGDNLEVLRRYVPDQSVDLVYLDPPFNSRQSAATRRPLHRRHPADLLGPGEAEWECRHLAA